MISRLSPLLYSFETFKFFYLLYLEHALGYGPLQEALLQIEHLCCIWLWMGEIVGVEIFLLITIALSYQAFKKGCTKPMLWSDGQQLRAWQQATIFDSPFKILIFCWPMTHILYSKQQLHTLFVKHNAKNCCYLDFMKSWSLPKTDFIFFLQGFC